MAYRILPRCLQLDISLALVVASPPVTAIHLPKPPAHKARYNEVATALKTIGRDDVGHLRQALTMARLALILF